LPQKTSSAEKATRTAERKRLRNKSTRSAIKTHLTRVDKLSESNDIEATRQATTVAISTLDRAANKGTIHRNTAARRKSRLMKKVNKAATSQVRTNGAKRTRAKKTPAQES
jgi:small subunit ribosomal protein S20